MSDYDFSKVHTLTYHNQTWYHSSKYIKLQEENKLLRECVEFYADPLTYTYDKRIQDVSIDAFGSKKARKTLAKIKGDENE